MIYKVLRNCFLSQRRKEIKQYLHLVLSGNQSVIWNVNRINKIKMFIALGNVPGHIAAVIFQIKLIIWGGKK